MCQLRFAGAAGIHFGRSAFCRSTKETYSGVVEIKRPFHAKRLAQGIDVPVLSLHLKSEFDSTILKVGSCSVQQLASQLSFFYLSFFIILSSFFCFRSSIFLF
jgi:hypothetical protein